MQLRRLAFAMILACSPKESAPDGCAARVAEMRALFAQGAADPVVMATPPGMKLAASSRGVAIADGLPVFVVADGTYVYDTRPRATIEELRTAMAEEIERGSQLARSTGGPLPITHLLVAADAGAPVDSVGRLITAVPAGSTFALIVTVAGDVVPTPPPMPGRVREVFALPADRRAHALAEVIETAVAGCEPIHEVFSAVAAVGPDERGKVVLEGLPPALAECRCAGVDHATLLR